MGIAKFEIPGQPVPKGRARTVVRGGRVGHYTPDKTVAYESKVRRAIEQGMEAQGIEMLTGGVSVSVRIFFAVPDSWSKAKQLAAIEGSLMHTSKPDIDNVIKAVFDGCNGSLWKDDSQVCDLRASKGYSEEPCVQMVVEWL